MTAVRIVRLPALVGLALLVAGCEIRLGQVSLFDDEPAVAKAMSAVESRYSGPARAFKVAITDDDVTFQMLDPGNAAALVEWRLERNPLLFWSYDRMTGPRSIAPVLINRKLDENLFDLRQVNLAGWPKLADAAIARAALEDRGGVSLIEIARPTVLLPSTHSGPVRWSIEVKSPREQARVFANAKGEITGANLNGTVRMRNLNMYQRPELAADAAAEVRGQVGNEPVLLKVSFNSNAIAFTTTLKDASFPIAGIAANSVFSWSYNGLQLTMGSPHIPRIVNPDAPFGIDEVDWSLAPKIVADARAALAMPNGRVTAIDLTKPTDGVGAPAPLWRVLIEENRERGEYTADAKGAAKTVLLPKSRRQPTNWLAPATVAQALTRIAGEFGDDARIVSILINDQGAAVVAEDPRNPGKPTRVLLREEGFTRFGTPMMIAEGRPFTMRDLKDLSEQRVAALAERTLKELNMPPGSVVRFTFGRGALQASRRGTVTAEVRAETPGRGHGRAVLELDGSVLEVIRP